MVQWKWVNIGLGLLVVLCAVVCWKDTASGIRMVAAIREWCQSTRSADHHRVLPLVPPRPDSGTATVESQPKPQQPDDRSFPPWQLKRRTIPSPKGEDRVPASDIPAITTVQPARTHNHLPTEPTPSTSTETTHAEPSAALSDSVLIAAPAPTPADTAAAVTKPSVAASGELETKAALERLFGVPFDKVRPSWLRNPATGRNLEIDCFNAALRIGVEYNGIQHYAYPNPFHKTADEFAAQLHRDELKKQLAEAIGVTLLAVPFTVKRKDIEAFLKAEFKSCGITTHAIQKDTP